MRRDEATRRGGEAGDGPPHVPPPAFLAAALLFVALNLRPAIASVSPVLGSIRRSDGLSPFEAGMLTTLPLVCFGLLALVTPRLVHRTGVGALLLGCLGGLAIGIALRSAPSVVTLYAGTLVIGVSVAVANVVMPGIVKKDFPGRVGLMTGLYTMALSAGPALAGASSVPLEQLLGGSWRLALGFWALPAALAAALWFPMRRHDRPLGRHEGPIPRHDRPIGPHDGGVPAEAPVAFEGVGRGDRVAWALTAYMGLQSLNFYVVLAWLPTVLHDRGTSLVTSGLLLALTSVAGIAAALVTPLVTHRMHDERVAVAVSTAALAVGVGGLLLDTRGLDALWVVMLGIGQGSAVSLALMMMVVRAWSSTQATALSGMAQGVGYLLAAAGPVLAGAVFAATGGWTAPLAILLGLLVPQLASGLTAGHGHVARPSGGPPVPAS